MLFCIAHTTLNEEVKTWKPIIHREHWTDHTRLFLSTQVSGCRWSYKFLSVGTPCRWRNTYHSTEQYGTVRHFEHLRWAWFGISVFPHCAQRFLSGFARVDCIGVGEAKSWKASNWRNNLFNSDLYVRWRFLKCFKLKFKLEVERWTLNYWTSLPIVTSD